MVTVGIHLSCTEGPKTFAVVFVSKFTNFWRVWVCFFFQVKDYRNLRFYTDGEYEISIFPSVFLRDFTIPFSLGSNR